MILELSNYIEYILQVPVNIGIILQTEILPAGTIRLDNATHAQYIGKRNKNNSGWRNEQIEISWFSLNYTEIEDLSNETLALLDGRDIDLESVTLSMTSVNQMDEIFPNPDGSDNFIYSRVLDFNAHYYVAPAVPVYTYDNVFAGGLKISGLAVVEI
jgi:hypothetical protein